jgi:hypothetical protein
MEVQHEYELGHLLTKMREYGEGTTALDELQKLIWASAQALTAYDARHLREQLQVAEGRVESIRFTVDQERVPEEVLKVLDDVEASVRCFLGDAA